MHSVLEGIDDVVSQINLHCMKVRYDLCPNVREYEVFRYLEAFTKYIELPLAPDESRTCN